MSQAAFRDPFVAQFFGRVPAEVAERFSNRQLAALKSVFGDATRAGHLVDIRLSIPIPFARRGVYLVLLAGRDRRRAERPHSSASRGRVGRLVSRLSGVAFVAQMLVAIAAGLYFLL